VSGRIAASEGFTPSNNLLTAAAKQECNWDTVVPQEPTSGELTRDLREPETIQALPELSRLTTPVSVFEDLVKTAVTRTGDNLAIYYKTVLEHTQKSFGASLLVAIAGFVLILFGMASAMFWPQLGTSVAVLSGAAGVATEFISAIFFYLYNSTVRQMKEYHQSLLDVQNILLALKVVADTTEPDRKEKMLESLLQYLVGPRRILEQPSPEAPKWRRTRKAAADS